MLRPTFYSFETAKRALASSQMGLDTVGHNISNVNTPGYTRQRVDQVTFNLGAKQTRFAAYGTNFPGQGAEVSGINQIRDPYLDRRFRTEAAKVGELSTASDGLDKLSRIFDEIQKTGSHAKMSEFLTELDALIAGADSPEQATVLKSKAEDLARVLNKNSIDLENAATQQKDEMLASVNQINVLLEQIADLNVKIKEDNFYGNPSNENNDLRNLYIDQLSELVDIDITRTPVKVTTDIFVENVKISIKGSKPEAVLVNGSLYNGVEAQFTNPLKPNKDTEKYEFLDEVSYHLIDGMTKMPIKMEGQKDGNITDFIMTGALKGHLDILNGKSTDAKAGENTYRGLPYTQKTLDDYAKKLAEVMNDLNAVQVWNPPTVGPPAADGFYSKIDRELFVASGVTGDITEYTRVNKNGDTVALTLADGTEVDAEGWRFVDTETGDILKADGTATGYNTADFERKLTARNIAVSEAWQEDPFFITRETLNNAIYTDATRFVKLNVDDGTPAGGMEDANPPIHFSDIKSIGAGGVLIDQYGETIKDVNGDEVTLDMLQKAMTETANKPPVIEDFFPMDDTLVPPATTFPTGELTFKKGTKQLDESYFFYKDGGTAADGALADWTLDKDGNLQDAKGNLVYLSTAEPPVSTALEDKPANISQLVSQVEDETQGAIPPIFNDYFPGGNMGKFLTVTKKNPDGTFSDVMYNPDDFGPGPTGAKGAYTDFVGWSIDGDTLVDAEGHQVYVVADIGMKAADLEQQTDYKPAVPLKVEDFLNDDGELVDKDGTTVYTPGQFSPGKADGTAYTDFKDWTVNDLGEFRDADGNRVYLTSKATAAVIGTPVKVKTDPTDGNEVGLRQWNFAKAPASIGDYINKASGTDKLILSVEATKTNVPEYSYGEGDFLKSGGAGGLVALDPGDFAGLAIDEEGYLTIPTGDAPPKPETERISLADDPSRKVNIKDLTQQVFQKYQIGEPTPNDLLPGEKANGNLDQIKIALTESRTFPNGFKGNFQEYLIGFQEDMANDKQTNDSLLSGTVNVMTGLADSRDGISAVSIDEEGISMMTYQNYYNAASRYMTTLDEALDKIINGMGTVGR